MKEIKSRVPSVRFVCTGLSQFRQFGPAIGAGGIREGLVWPTGAGVSRICPDGTGGGDAQPRKMLRAVQQLL